MSKETVLDAQAAALRDFVPNEVPPAVTWNENVTKLRAALQTLGDYFTQTDGDVASLMALFLSDHPGGVNPVPPEWVADTATPIFLSANQLQLPGDRRADYVIGHRIRATVGVGVYALVSAQLVGYDAIANRTTITVEPPLLTAGMSAIARGLVRFSVPRIGSADLLPNAVTSPAVTPLSILTTHLGISVAAHVHFGVTRDIAAWGGSEETYLSLTIPATRGARALLLGGLDLSLQPSSTCIVRLRRISPSPAELRLVAPPASQVLLLAAITSGVTAERTYRLTVHPSAVATMDNGWLDYLEFA